MKMRKKIFAILMTIMMMVTFMPSMAFATDSTPSKTLSTSLKDTGSSFDIDFQSIACDAKDYVVEKSGYVENFKPQQKWLTISFDGVATADGVYTIKTSATKGVTLYFSKDDGSNWYAMPKNEIRFEISAGAYKVEMPVGEWQKSYDKKISVVPVIKNELPKSKAFDINLVFIDADGNSTPPTTAAFNGTGAEAKIGDTYYRELLDAVRDVKAGQTITLLKENIDITKASEVAKKEGKKSFTIDASGNSVYASSLGEGITYKNMKICGGNVSVGSNTTIKKCFVYEDMFVAEDSTGVKLENIVIGEGKTLTCGEATEVKMSGCYVNNAGPKSSYEIKVSKYSKLDISDLEEYGLVSIVLADETRKEKVTVTLNDDERWIFDGNGYCLTGKYVYKGTTYLHWEDVVTAIGQNRDLNPTVKVVNYTEEEPIGPFVENQTLTLTGTENSRVSNFMAMEEFPEGSKIVLKSGNYDCSEFDVNLLLNTKASIMCQDDLYDNNNYIYADRYVVGKDLILKELNLEDGDIDSYTSIETLGNDLSAEKLCEQIAKFQEKNPTYRIRVRRMLGKDLLAVGKEYKMNIAKYLRFPSEELEEVYGFKQSNGKYVILTKDEYDNDFRSNYYTVSRFVQQTKPTIKSTSLSTSSAKLTASKGFKVEVAGKTGTVTGLKAGAIKTYKVKPYMTVANGKFKIYGKTQSVVVRSKAYTPKVKVGKKSVKVSFKKMSGAKKYQVSVSRSKTKKNVKSYSAKRSVKIKNLKSKKTYYVKVRTVDSKGRKGAWSVAKAVKVK